LAKLHVSYMSTPFDQLKIFFSGNWIEYLLIDVNVSIMN
jgi:hypothetical protein